VNFRAHITALSRIGEEIILEHGLIVIDDPNTPAVIWESETYLGYIARSAEGTGWIRDHHKKDSPEVRAMLSAYALVYG